MASIFSWNFLCPLAVTADIGHFVKRRTSIYPNILILQE